MKHTVTRMRIFLIILAGVAALGMLAYALPVINPTLTVTTGEVSVTRGGVTTTYTAPATVELEVGDVIETADGDLAGYRISGIGGEHDKIAVVTNTGSKMYYVKNYEGVGVFVLKMGEEYTIHTVKVDPPPFMVLQTDYVGVDLQIGSIAMAYDTSTSITQVVCLEGSVDLFAHTDSSAVVTVYAGDKAVYNGSSLDGVSACTEPFPQPPEAPTVAERSTSRVKLSWDAVTHNIAGFPIAGVSYQVFRSTTSCEAEGPDVFIGWTSDLFYWDFVPAVDTYYYRIGAIHDASGLEGPASPQTMVAVIDDIPTLSEWGIIIFSLVVLSLITVAMTRRKAVLAGAGGTVDTPSAVGSGPLFVPAVYVKVLAVTMVFAGIGLVIALAVSGTMAARDVAGTLLSAAGVAYMAHVWISRNRE